MIDVEKLEHRILRNARYVKPWVLWLAWAALAVTLGLWGWEWTVYGRNGFSEGHYLVFAVTVFAEAIVLQFAHYELAMVAILRKHGILKEEDIRP